MAREFDGNSRKISDASTAAVTRALEIDASRWSALQQQALESWSLVLALIPGITRWSPGEKRQLVKIIRAKSAPNEMTYLRQTQHHPRLRDELLRVGSQ
jgi:CelD/BcsL family acetyltransferase involved in cellulose biosynthesis